MSFYVTQSMAFLADNPSETKSEHFDRITNFVNSYDAHSVSYNMKWSMLRCSEWVMNENHPCPVVVVSGPCDRIAQYSNHRQYAQPLEWQQSDLNLHQTRHVVQSKKDSYVFYRKVDSFIMGKYPCFGPQENPHWKQAAFIPLIRRMSLGEVAFMQWQVTEKLTINLIIKKSPKQNNNRAAKTSKKVGWKIAIQIVCAKTAWDTFTVHQKRQHLHFSWALCQRLYSVGNVSVGDYAYFYKYPVQSCRKEGIIRYYLDYKAEKPLSSVIEYYELFRKDNEVRTQQKKYSPPGHKLSSNYGCFTNHKLWLGLTQHLRVLTRKEGLAFKALVSEWTEVEDLERKQGIRVDRSSNRYKFYIYFWYEYNKQSHMKAGDLAKARSKKGGLRNMKSVVPIVCPEWLLEMIHILRQRGFIPKTANINQIGINLYHGQGSKSYGSIQPHHEHDKFKSVYSVSIYSHPDKMRGNLSFNLKSNWGLGDVTIPLYDLSGLIMQS